MILLCELAIKSEGTRFLLTLDNKVTTKLLSFSIIFFSLPKNLTVQAQMPSSGPLFITEAMGRIPVTLNTTLLGRTIQKCCKWKLKG